jgi:hypothetical protein
VIALKKESNFVLGHWKIKTHSHGIMVSAWGWLVVNPLGVAEPMVGWKQAHLLAVASPLVFF